jgi:competence protein ComEC
MSAFRKIVAAPLGPMWHTPAVRSPRVPAFLSFVVLLAALGAGCGHGAAAARGAGAPSHGGASLASGGHGAAAGGPGTLAGAGAGAVVVDTPLGAGALEVHFIDVGQGDSALVLVPGGQVVLIDAGDTDAGPAVVTELRAAGVKAIDLFVWTHPHADHIGGAMAVLDAFEVRRVLDSGYPHTTATYKALLERVKAKGIAYEVARAGRDLDAGGGAVLHVLGPPEPLLSGTRSDPNANSVVLRLEYGAASVLFAGDAEAETEDKLLAAGAPLRADVLKVAHHGSRYATGAGLLAKVAPAVAVVSVGAGNSYGHPAPETLDRLTATGARVLRTDLAGTVLLRTDGTTIEVSALRAAEAIRLAAGPRGPPGAHAGAGPRPGPAPGPGPALGPGPVPAPGGGPAVATAVPAAPGPGGPSTAAPTAGRLLDLNRATAAELETLPGIGPAKAAAIVADRTAAGPFRSVEDLARVKGVGPKTLEKLRSLVTVGAAPPGP